MMRRSWLLPCLATPLLWTAALGQSALVAVSHSDPGGMILPGETIHVTVFMSWTPPGTQLAGLAGGIRTESAGVGSQGMISNRVSVFQSGIFANLGTIVGDDIVGIDLASVPAFFLAWLPHPWGWSGGFNAFEHDWTAPATPGVYHISFVPSPLHPDVQIYPSVSSVNPVEVPTTYIGTSITVIPAPGGLALLCVPAITCRRQRRPSA